MRVCGRWAASSRRPPRFRRARAAAPAPSSPTLTVQEGSSLPAAPIRSMLLAKSGPISYRGSSYSHIGSAGENTHFAAARSRKDCSVRGVSLGAARTTRGDELSRGMSFLPLAAMAGGESVAVNVGTRGDAQERGAPHTERGEDASRDNREREKYEGDTKSSDSSYARKTASRDSYFLRMTEAPRRRCHSRRPSALGDLRAF